MATYLTAFNNLIFKFTDDLIETFPEENDFKVYKRGLTILKSANAKKMCVIFKAYSHIYKEKILSKDESFFIKNDYSEIKEATEDENTVEAVINKLKLYWTGLSQENKEKIWKYLETLIKLSDLIS
jgi:hypothetical protein